MPQTSPFNAGQTRRPVSSTVDLKSLLRRLGGREPAPDLPLEEAEKIFGAILDGAVPPLLLGALLMALRWKRETAEELAGFARAANRRILSLPLPPRATRTVVIPSYALRQSRQPNLMPLLALLLARYGLAVLIHGNPHPACRSRSFEVLARLGHLPVTSLADMEAHFALHNLAVVPTEMMSPAIARMQRLRATMGLGNVADLVARLLDPSPEHCLRLICVSDPQLLERLRLSVATDPAHALLMRATDGEAYANPMQRPRIEFFHAYGSEMLFPSAHVEAPSGGTHQACDVSSTARVISEILAGHRPVPQAILHQVASCLYASGHSRDMAHAKALVSLGVPAPN